jgi:CheY-like chemotaxis protein
MPAESDAAVPIRVFLVDDHRVVRSGVSAYLDQVEDIEVIGEAGGGRQALDRIASLEPGGNLPDVVLMDLLMPGLDGITATRQVKSRWPAVEVVVMTSFAEEANADFHTANRPPVWGHMRWQRGRGGSASRGDRTPSRPSPMITAAPVLTFLTTNYMGMGCVATPSTRAVNGGVIREKDEESAGHPPAMRRPAATPDAKRLHNDIARRSSAVFPSVSRGGSWPRKSALMR